MQTIEFIDSHTGGEPTRTVLAGGPDLGSGDMAQRANRLKDKHDWLRKSLILEPRGCDWLVGALLQKPSSSENTAGVIFFNNVGYLGMCGHGLIGVVKTLAHLGRISPGAHRFETPVGVVSVELHEDRAVSFTNVVSYRYRKDVALEVPAEGIVRGDIAYGGNWFFLAPDAAIDSLQLDRLHARVRSIRTALQAQGICGADAAEIDHIELFGPASDANKADSRNFVLCPGGEYDRSPCGTGTSAKLACLAADGELQPGEIWRQQSITGSVFSGSFHETAGGILPTIAGRAHVTAQGACLIDDDDPFRHGIA